MYVYLKDSNSLQNTIWLDRKGSSFLSGKCCIFLCILNLDRTQEGIQEGIQYLKGSIVLPCNTTPMSMWETHLLKLNYLQDSSSQLRISPSEQSIQLCCNRTRLCTFDIHCCQ
jgi:hypothetical protein